MDAGGHEVVSSGGGKGERTYLSTSLNESEQPLSESIPALAGLVSVSRHISAEAGNCL